MKTATKKQTVLEALEEAAQDLVKSTPGLTIDQARIGIRVEMAKLSIRLGRKTLAQVNEYLSPYGVVLSMRQVSK